MRVVTEHEFQREVIRIARANGWLIYHATPTQVRPGRWVTAQSGHPGFPDLVLAHYTKAAMIVAELKTDTGKTTPEQMDWLMALDRHITTAVWRPCDLEHITRLLENP